MTTLSARRSRPPAGRASRLLASLKRSYSLIQALGVLLMLIVIMQIANDRFLSPINIGNLLGQMTVMLIVAAGMTIVMIAGEFDVSVGSVVGLSAAVAGWLMVRWMPVGDRRRSAMVGDRRRARRAAVRRAAVRLCRRPGRHQGEDSVVHRDARHADDGAEPDAGRHQGQPIPDIPQAIRAFGQGRWVQLPLPIDFSATGNFRLVRRLFVWFPIQNIVWVAVIVYAVGWFVLERTAFGKRVYAVGSNRTVAMLSGIRADRIKIQCLMIVGFTASLAGLVSVSRLGAVSPNTGEGLEFEVIAAVVIGGTSLYGGQGKILRTIIGVIIIALTRNFLNLARIEIFWQGFATGTIILAAVLLEALQRRISDRG